LEKGDLGRFKTGNWIEFMAKAIKGIAGAIVILRKSLNPAILSSG
jgi:hypothetical protein